MFTSFSTLRAHVQDRHDQVIADARRSRRHARPEPEASRPAERPALRLLQARG